MNGEITKKLHLKLVTRSSPQFTKYIFSSLITVSSFDNQTLHSYLLSLSNQLNLFFIRVTKTKKTCFDIKNERFGIYFA